MNATMAAPRAPGTVHEALSVRDLMTTSPVSVRHNATLREAAALLGGRRIGAVPVVNDAGHAVGVLSQFDVLLAVSAGLIGAPVREVMTASVIAVPAHTLALDALDYMVRHMVHRVFVVDDANVPIGVVSMTDLSRGLAAVWSAPSDTKNDLTSRS